MFPIALVPNTLVPVLLHLLVWIILVNLETLVYMKTECTLKTHCGMVMDVVQANSCCAQAGMPWFCRTLPQEVSEDIEVRVCANGAISDEEIYMEQLEVYVQ